MAHLPNAEIVARRTAATQDIISVWQGMQGHEWYVVQCPCRLDVDACQMMKSPELSLVIVCMSGRWIISLLNSRSRPHMALKSGGTVTSVYLS